MAPDQDRRREGIQAPIDGDGEQHGRARRLRADAAPSDLRLAEISRT